MALAIAPVLIQPGALRFSATKVIPSLSRDVTIQMTDNGSDWFGVTPAAFGGLVGNILIWGWQISTDGGVTWTWKHWQPGRDDPAQYALDGSVLAFGTPSKSGLLLPSLNEVGPDIVTNAGDLARLAVAVDTAIHLGATITPA